MRRFILSYDGEWCWCSEFDIDVEKAAPACLDSLNFFGDPVTRGESSIEIVQAFLKFWGPAFTKLSDECLGIEERMIERFAEIEGSIRIDGTQGIKLISSYRWEWDRDNFNITSVKKKTNKGAA